MTVSDGNQAERVIGELVSGNFFNVLGVGAHLGRVFSDADDQTPGGHFVTVISYNYWRRRFGSDPQIVGRKIRVNNYPFTIIGVAAQNSKGDYKRVVIINDSFARYFFGDENPLGKRLSVGPLKKLEIVGVVGNARLGKPQGNNVTHGLLCRKRALPWKAEIVRARDGRRRRACGRHS
jgi:hypothetical protein